MRFRSAVAFGRVLGAAGTGAYLGAACAGLIAIVSGQALQPASPWLIGLPVLAVLGAVVGAVLSPLSRRWFVPALRRRTVLFSAAGIPVLPMAAATAQLHELDGVAVVLMAAGSVITLVIWTRAIRRAPRGLPQRQAAGTGPAAR